MVELSVEAVLGSSGRVVWDHCDGVHSCDELAEVIGVVGGIGEHDPGALARHKSGSFGYVTFVATGQMKSDRTTKASYGQVDFGAQAATRSAKRLIFSPLFAPAACW